MKNHNFLWLLIGVVIFANFSCNNPSSKDKEKSKYEIVYQKTFGMTEVTMCLVKDTSEAELKKIGKGLTENKQFSFVFFYSDKNEIKNINLSTDGIDAMPNDGYIAEYTSVSGFKKNVTLYVVEKPNGPVKITLLESKTRTGKGHMKEKYRWYTYYVQNYVDTKETDNKMIEVAEKLPVDNGYDANLGFDRAGFTEVFFFNDKDKAPKLANDGGWGAKESQTSWNKKYGKYCVGYYLVGGGNKGELTKGWK